MYSTSHIFNSDENPVTLVKLVLYTGDEIIRRLVTSLSSDQCTSELIDALKGYFVEQDTAPSGMYNHVCTCTYACNHVHVRIVNTVKVEIFKWQKFHYFLKNHIKYLISVYNTSSNSENSEKFPLLENFHF